MWRNEIKRRDDPVERDRETERLARDEYDRPRYGSAAGDFDPRAAGEPGPGAGGHREEPRYHGEGAPEPNPLEEVRLSELMTRRVTSAHPHTSVERAARLMEECDCGALPVLGDNGVPVGMVTDRDIALRIVARGRDARNAMVADCMTEHVFACYAHESVAECMRLMARHQVRRVPIVDDRGRLVGIVTQADLARHAKYHPLREEQRTLAEVVGSVSEPAELP